MIFYSAWNMILVMVLPETNMTERPELSLTIFTPDVETTVDTYRGTADLDERAKLLNDRIVQTDEGIATAPSIRDLMVLSSDPMQLTQYRPDSVSALTHANLVAVARGLIALKDQDSLLEAAKQIERAAGGGSTGGTGLIEREAAFRQHVMEELAERLSYTHSGDHVEARELIGAINGLATAELEDLMESNQDTASALLMRVYEIENPLLRKVILKRMPTSAERVTLLGMADEEIKVSRRDIYEGIANTSADDAGDDEESKDREADWGSVESLRDEEDDTEEDW